MNEQELRRVVEAATDRALDEHKKKNQKDRTLTPARRKEIADYYREYAEKLENWKQ